ncbi:MAG: sterol desaturase family protein [Alphaproteobacteria bacterium]|nr:sterol desaturase family protein [Alphaproteobacteria bacterium]MCB9696653.1 sterol desaturase family protein [Alphaproteobacteria bacterium]
MTVVVAFVGGLVLWTFMEYVLHRFAFHEKKLGAAMAREHLEHHAKIDWFAPWSSKISLAIPVVAAVGLLSFPVGWAVASALVGGLVTGWLLYEALHRRLHVVGPSTAYGRWARLHHFHHHFADPRRNHGVTSPVWDIVFRTHTPVQRVTVPRRQADRLPWLLVDGAVPESLREDWVVPPARKVEAA